MSTETTADPFAPGEAHALAGNRPLMLDGEREAWRVESGYVDLFAIVERNGEIFGARQHLARMVAGEVFFPVAPVPGSPASGRYGVIAVGSIGALARRTSLGAFARLPEGEIALALERWARKLYGGVFHDATAWPARVSVPGETASLKAGERIDGHPQRPAWLVCEEGSVSMQGEATLVIAPGAPAVPMLAGSWLKATADTRLQAIDTAAAVGRFGLEALLEELHRITMALAQTQRERRASMEQERLTTGSAATQSSVEAALGSLAELARSGRMRPTPPPSVDPVLQNCAEVGFHRGFAVRSPAGTPLSDPDDQLTAIARASGLTRRRVLLPENWWQADSGPFIGYLDHALQPVALLPCYGRGYGYEMFDPRDNTRTAVTPELAGHILPEAVVLQPALGGEAVDAVRLLGAGLAGTRRDRLLIALLGMVAGLIAIATPVVTGIIFDHVIPQASRNLLWQAIGALVAFALGAAAFDLVRATALTRLEGRVDWTLQSGLMSRLLGLSAPFFRRYASGDLADRVLGIQAIRETLTGATLTTLLSGVFSLFSFALLFWYSWKLALIATALTLVAVAVTALVNRRKLRAERERVHAQGRVEGFVMQVMLGMAKLRVAAAERRAFAQWAGRYGQQKAHQVASRRCDSTLLAFFETFGVLCSMVLFASLMWLMEYEAREATLQALAGTRPGEVSKPMSTGAFLAFNAAFGQFIAAVTAVARALAGALAVVPMYQRLRPLLEARAEASAQANDPGRLHGRIEVTRALFRYDDSDAPVLNQLSLRVAPGEFLAVVGPSGSGKSTLFRVLLGFEKLDGGEVFYDGKAMGALDVAAVRRQIGVVLQSGQQLSGSLYANIVGSSGLSLDDAWHAARLVGLEQDILDMPMQMHTVLSDGASTLSGGQRQRLLLARALVHRPSILLLDEATSALDNRTQAIVTDSLSRLNVTRIIVAHRLSTVAMADRIVVIDRGAVVQSGSYQELMESPGPFYELARRQML